MDIRPADQGPLLCADDPPAVTRVNERAPASLVLCCDHASRAVPKNMGRMGLGPDQFDRHIAYDIGAEAVTRNLAEALDVQAVIAGYSRLVLDLNRPPGHPDQMPEISDNTVIPPNQDMTAEERLRRIEEIFEPYHSTLRRALVETWERRRRAPALFSVHSFSPGFGDEERPWDIGVMWNRDERMSRPVIESLKQYGLRIGENEPYSGRAVAYTMNSHGGASGLAHCAVEINQDQLTDLSGIERWSTMLAEVMSDLINSEDWYHVQFF